MIDQILAEHNHTTLRLPLYHPDLNPIELLWGDVKQWIAARNVTFKLKDVEILCRQRFQEIGKTEWEKACRHVQKIEQEYWVKDAIVEERIEQIIIQDNGMESSNEDNENNSNSYEEEDEGEMSGIEEMQES